MAGSNDSDPPHDNTMSNYIPPPPGAPFFVFDVESVGLYGEGFAVAGGVYANGLPHVPGKAPREFQFSCPPTAAEGAPENLAWVESNVQLFRKHTAKDPREVRHQFWQQWERAKAEHPGILMAGECIYPVESSFVAACIKDHLREREWEGPYPMMEIASFMSAAGMDPMEKYLRGPQEEPEHNPLADARLSARLLAEALRTLSRWRNRDLAQCP